MNKKRILGMASQRKELEMAEVELSGPLPETMSTGPAAPVKPGGIPDMPKQHSCLHKLIWRVINFVRTYFLPLALIHSILFGALVPWPGQFLAKTPLKFILVFIIFLLQGLGLNASEIKRALKACSGIFCGIFTILGVTPLLALAVVKIPFDPPEFAIGLAIFCCMPTTVSSGVALAREAGGNAALAIMLTVGTNVLGIFVCPIMLSTYLATDEEISLDYFDLLWKLLVTVLVPFLLGQIIRCIPFIPKIMTKGKEYFGYFSACCLALIPFMTISKSADSLVDVTPQSYTFIILAAVGVHFIYLAYTMVTTYSIRMNLEIQKTVVILGSQKTLPVAMSILTFFPDSIGEKGLISIPVILAHLSQIIIDAIIVARWKRATGRKPTLCFCGGTGYKDVKEDEEAEDFVQDADDANFSDSEEVDHIDATAANV